MRAENGDWTGKSCARKQDWKIVCTKKRGAERRQSQSDEGNREDNENTVPQTLKDVKIRETKAMKEIDRERLGSTPPTTWSATCSPYYRWAAIDATSTLPFTATGQMMPQNLRFLSLYVEPHVNSGKILGKIRPLQEPCIDLGEIMRKGRNSVVFPCQ